MAEHDSDTGQFTSAEPLFGQAGIEQDAGYAPMPEREREETPDELSVREAAEELDRQHSAPADATIRTYFDGNDFAGETETVTLERAAKDLTEVHAEEAAEREAADLEKVRAEVDKLRGVDPEAKDKPATEEEAVADGADPELAEIERALNNPRVKSAIQQQIGETEQARQAYSKGVEVANEFARASLAQNVPELASLPVEHWDNALMQMRQTNPQRFNEIIGQVQRVAELQTAQQQQQQQRQQETAFRERQEVETYSKAQGQRFDKMIRGETPAARRAVEDSIVEAIREYGGDTDAREFFELMKSSKFLNSATAQRLMWDAGKYRQMQKAGATAKAAAKSLPPVQRPGSSAARSQGNGPDMAALDRRLSESGSAKDAVALYLAQQSRKRG